MTEGEFKEWLHNPVTEHFYNVLRKRRNEIMLSWANEAYVNDQHANSRALGMYYVLGAILDQDYEGLQEALRD